MTTRRCAGCESRYVAYELTFRSLDNPRSVKSNWYCHSCWGVFLQVIERLQVEIDRELTRDDETEVVLPESTMIGRLTPFMPRVRKGPSHPSR